MNNVTVPKDINKLLILATTYVHVDDLKRKRALVRTKLTSRMRPTENMQDLLNFIRRKQSLTFYETLAADWRYLGGLLVRGLVEWYIVKHDGKYVRCVRAVR